MSREAEMAQNGKQKKPVLVEVEAILAVGEYPEDHPHAGKFAIQVMIKPFDTRELANAFADRNILPIVETIMGKKALLMQ